MAAGDASAKTFRVGCQSWGYEDWITPPGAEYVFYQPGTKSNEMLAIYSKVFDTVEVDATLYGVPPATTFRKWYEQTPDDFLFSLKFPREITHDKGLTPETIPVMEQFVERSRLLKNKLGVLLVQLPASFHPSIKNLQNLRDFLSHLPRDIRFAVEFRNENWMNDGIFKELERHGMTLSLVEGPWLPRESMFKAIGRLKADFAYIRIMGRRDLKKFDRISRHRDEVLVEWTVAAKELIAKEVFMYVSNTFEGFSPGSAAKLQSLLGVPVSNASDYREQGSLF
jgi:uncharacterized protein YecE (DUF72 family)